MYSGGGRQVVKVRREFFLDATEMAPPEPFEKATAILRQLQPGQYLHMQHRRIPWPLFDFIRGLSLQCSYVESAPSVYEIYVYFLEDEETLKEEGIPCE